MKATKPNPRTDSATLSPAAECWWERGGTCTYLKLAVTENFTERRIVSITEEEARTLRALLNNPEWWTDLEELGN